jgi:predicted adenylyl cyclase CyaB
VRNLEIKAVAAKPSALARRVAELPAKLASDERQTDTYFHVASGRLKLRERSGAGSELIFYRRPEASARRVSDYFLYRVDDTRRLKRFLADSFDVRVVVAKRRAVYLYKNARIHLDKVKGLGHFAEIEVVIDRGERQAQQLMTDLLRRLEIDARDLIRASYSDMLLKAGRPGKAEALPYRQKLRDVRATTGR